MPMPKIETEREREMYMMGEQYSMLVIVSSV